MLNLLTAEKIKLMRSWKLWVLLGLFITYPLIQFLGFKGEADGGKEIVQRIETVVDGSTGVLMMAKIAATIQLMIGVFVSLNIGEEFQHGTIRNALALGRSRAHYYATKFLVAFGMTLLAMIVVTVIGVGTYGVAFGFNPISGISDYASYAVQVLVVQFLLMMATSSAFVAITFIVRSPAMSIVWTAIYAIALGFLPGIFQKFEGLGFLTWWFSQSYMFYSDFASQDYIAQFPKMALVSIVTIMLSSIVGYGVFAKSDIK